MLGDGYRFISTQPMREERRKLGYDQIGQPVFEFRAHESEQAREEAQELIASADIVIAGSAPESIFRERIRAGKVIFRYAERLLKQEVGPLERLYLGLKWHIKAPVHKPIFLLGAGAYVAGDLHRFGLFKKTSYQWGYFPVAEEIGDSNAFFAAKKKTMILWCGRFLSWKHPEYAIEVARRLREEGIQFEMVLIGSGEMEEQLRQSVASLGLQDWVRMPGAMPPRQVRVYMKEAGIYLFTSGRQEGWGAVLNESMNSGCAVIASHAIGAVPYLIEDGHNGWIYRSGDVDMLYEKVKRTLANPEEQSDLGRKAYDTITQLWNAEVAAKRLLELSKRILSGEKSPDLFENGPCAKAYPICDGWDSISEGTARK